MTYMKKNHLSFFERCAELSSDFKILLRSVPSPVITVFILSVVCANLMANKELFSCPYVALDCGFAFSWIMFLCMDTICRRWGAAASVKVSVFALAVNLIVCLCFFVLSKTPGMWGEFYSVENPDSAQAVNSALNRTFGGSWYVVFGSATAFLFSSVVNAVVNSALGKICTSGGFKSFAVRSYVSTFVAQFSDNFIFAVVVSKVFFGWTWMQVIVCSIVAAVFELLCEVLFSGIGWKMVCAWEKDNVGAEYVSYLEEKKLRRVRPDKNA